MSLNRRRWSNEFMDSLIHFQSRDSDSINKTVLFDSLESKKIEISVDSLDNKCIDTTSMLAIQNNLTQESVKENSKSKSNLIISDSDNKLENNKFFNNLNLIEDNNISNEELNLRLPMNDTININISNIDKDNSNTSGKSENSNTGTSQINRSFNLNERLNENIDSSSDSETIKEFYKLNNETESIKSQCSENSSTTFEEHLIQLDYILNMDEKTIENIKNCFDNRTIRSPSCNYNDQKNVQIKLKDHEINQDKNNDRYFSTPLEFSPTDQEIIAEMNKPDIWDTLLALEQVLSPVEQNLNFEECSQENQTSHSHILSRLSQKFKKTPARFTEKLVSIIENSVISSESPTKQNPNNNSGISLHRMTGEFRKLCKFIEDESMPEWAPSLMNMTGSYYEKTETPVYEIKSKNVDATPKHMVRLIKDTPTREIIPKKLNPLETPKNKIISNVNSPVNRFTPTADKSFEYWEKVCNMMCDNKTSAKKNATSSLQVADSTKSNMSEMLTICERQLASLDDSTIDIRNSEPCKKTNSALKIKENQALRSKSESLMTFDTIEKRVQSSKKCKDGSISKALISENDYESSKELKNLKINDKLAFDTESILQSNKDLEVNTSLVNEDFDLLTNRDLGRNEQEIFEKDFDLLIFTPDKKQDDETMQDSYDENEQDCSLLLELAKRRQRCLDTAKLMLEIDREDPTVNEDSKCIETLYKLGIQDKTFAEVEEDTKFLHTLSQCIDYKNYISTKSKPLVNMLSELNSPQDVKNKATSAIRSKKLFNQPQLSNRITRSHKKPNPRLELTNSSKKVQDKKFTSRLTPKPIAKTIPKMEKKTPLLLDLRQQKETPRACRTTLHSSKQKIPVTPREMSKTSTKITPQVNKISLQADKSDRKVPQKLITKPSIKVLQSDQKSQSNKLTPKLALTPTPKTTSRLEQQASVLRATPKLAASKTAPNVEVDNCSGHGSPVLRILHQNHATPQSSKPKLFLTPGKSPRPTTLGRKKPQSYFSDEASKKTTPLKSEYNNVKSPISLYIHGTDTDLIQNVHGRINDRLLTPVLDENAGKVPKLKFALSSKENKSPISNCNENVVLPTVRYQSAKNVHLIDDKSSYSPSSLTPNSRTKKLLGPIENTVVIRHEGRIIDYSPKADYMNSETSIRVQKMAEKSISTRKKCI